MGGLDRSRTRVKETGEVFTPTALVEEMLDKMDVTLFSDPVKTFLDPSAGDGQFLASVLYRKLEHGHTFEQALSTIYGVDLMPDNVQLCRDRLLCGREDLRHVVERNIVCHDALEYDYSFNGTNLTDAQLREQTLGLPAVTKKAKKPKKTKTETTIITTCFQ